MAEKSISWASFSPDSTTYFRRQPPFRRRNTRDAINRPLPHRQLAWNRRTNPHRSRRFSSRRTAALSSLRGRGTFVRDDHQTWAFHSGSGPTTLIFIGNQGTGHRRGRIKRFASRHDPDGVLTRNR